MNTYIMNVAILSVVYYVVIQVFLILIITPKYFCWVYYLGISALCLQYLMAFCMLLDWTLTTFKASFIEKIGNFHKHIFFILYLFSLAVYVFQILMDCHLQMLKTDLLFFRIAFITICFAMAILDIILIRINVPKEATKEFYVVKIANLYVFAWLPELIIHDLLQDVDLDFHIVIYKILVFLGKVSVICAYACPILVYYLLVVHNKHFRLAFYRSWKRSLKNYESDDLDIVSNEEGHGEGPAVDVIEPSLIIGN